MKTLVGAEDDYHFLPGPRAVHGGKEQRAGQEGQQVSQQACAEVCPIEGFRRQSSINVPINWSIYIIYEQDRQGRQDDLGQENELHQA